MKVALTDAEWARVFELEAIAPEARTIGETAALEALKLVAQSIAAQPELADDPRTLADESRRPNLDGTDWNDFNNAMCRDEVKQLGVKYGLPLLKLAVEALLRA